MKFNKLFEETQETYCSRALSDNYLKEHGHQTAEEYGIGEYGYGIVTVPVVFILPFLEVINKVFYENSGNFCDTCCAKNQCNGKCCYEQIKEMFEEAEETKNDW